MLITIQSLHDVFKFRQLLKTDYFDQNKLVFYMQIQEFED